MDNNYCQAKEVLSQGCVWVGADYRDLSRRILVFWKEGCLWEVVMNERWSHMEVQLYLPYHLMLLVSGNLIIGN